ncbi:hypothetical protein ABZ355_42150, partial [Streptomyces sp. NPDC005989]
HAVAQGIATPYNSGVNEGRITDVKPQKRLMAGRASVSLLRHRVVLIAHLRRRYADRPTMSPGRSPATKILPEPSTCTAAYGRTCTGSKPAPHQ